MTKPRRTRVEQGIFADRWGIAVCASVSGKQVERRYPADTPIDELRAARLALRAELARQLGAPRRRGRPRKEGHTAQPVVMDRIAHRESVLATVPNPSRAGGQFDSGCGPSPRNPGDASAVDLLSLAQCCGVLGLKYGSDKTLRVALQRGALPYVERLDPRNRPQYFVRRGDLLRWFATHYQAHRDPRRRLS